MKIIKWDTGKDKRDNHRIVIETKITALFRSKRRLKVPWREVTVPTLLTETTSMAGF
jgi:hypothetical protein